MAPNTGVIYRDEELVAAQREGIKTVPVSPEFAAKFESGSTEAQRAAQALEQIKARMPYLSVIEQEKRALEAARG